MIIGIDPGTTKSGIVTVSDDATEILYTDVLENNDILCFLELSVAKATVIEIPEGRGMPVGQTTLDTSFWAGRFAQVFPGNSFGIYRRYLKHTLCGKVSAKDSNVRQAVIDRYPENGGGKTPQVGTKKEPGTLYGVSTHAWQALGLIHAYLDLMKFGSDKIMYYPK